MPPRLTLTKKDSTEGSVKSTTKQTKLSTKLPQARRLKPVIRSANNEVIVSTESCQKKSTRLCDKLETPAISSRKKKFTLDTAKNTREKTFSLVNKKKSAMSDLPLKHNSCIVCLKVNKTLFNQIFSTKKQKNYGETVRPLEESTTNISDTMTYELSQDKTLNIPDIYGLSEFDIKPDRVNFKRYSDIDEDCLNEKLNNYKLGDKKIHLVLASFKNKPWPNSSPYNCFYCDEPFDNAPVGIPTIAMSDSYEDSYYLEGNYCSFNCAAKHLFETRSSGDSQLFTIYEIMNFIYNEVNDSEDYEKIKLAPDRLSLKKFGGPLTLEEFRKNSLTNIDYELFKSPLIPALYHIQENIDLNKLIKNKKR